MNLLLDLLWTWQVKIFLFHVTFGSLKWDGDYSIYFQEVDLLGYKHYVYKHGTVKIVQKNRHILSMT